MLFVIFEGVDGGRVDRRTDLKTFVLGVVTRSLSGLKPEEVNFVFFFYMVRNFVNY